MKISRRFLWAIFILIAGINLFIFISRNNGFEYKKFSDLEELYPGTPSPSFFNKWAKQNQRFSKEELKQGLSLLQRQIGIDSISNEEDKVIRIAAWLYQSFYKQLGTPGDTLSKLPPLGQYQYLTTHTDKQLWCAHLQSMFGFFCTAAGLPNRYVEIVPANDKPLLDYHEVNEVYINPDKKWIMVDVTRNLLEVRIDNHLILSAASYFIYKLRKERDQLSVTKFDTASLQTITVKEDGLKPDSYFNEDHLLRYYHVMNLSNVYSPASKIKRYILADPWYEMYEPGKHHSNLLFRIRQFCILSLVISAGIIFFSRGKKKKA